MNPKLMNCPKCNHAVSNSAAACAYCGTVISEEKSTSQPNEPASELEIQSFESAPQIQEVTEPPAMERAVETQSASPESAKQPQIELSEQMILKDTVTEKIKPEEEPAPLELAPEIAELADDTSAPEGDVAPNAAPNVDEPIKTEAGAAEPTVPQEPEISKSAASASDTQAAGILGAIEVDASQSEAAISSKPESTKPSGDTVTESKLDLTENERAVKGEEVVVEQTGSPKSDVFGETILLTPENEVQPAEKALQVKIEYLEKGNAVKPDSNASAPAAETTEIPDPSSAGVETQTQVEAIQKQSDAQALTERPKEEKAAPEKTEAQMKQIAVLAMAEAEKKQKAMMAEAEAFNKHKAALAKVAALKKQKLYQIKAEALKRKKAVLAKTEALKKQAEAQAKIQAGKTEKATVTTQPAKDNHQIIIQGLKSNTKMMGLLKKYEGRAIGINYDNSNEIKEAELVEANDELFSVFVKDRELQYSYPLNTILTVIEGADGVESVDSEPKAKFDAVIKVYPLVSF
jgi:hypothetical protein